MMIISLVHIFISPDDLKISRERNISELLWNGNSTSDTGKQDKSFQQMMGILSQCDNDEYCFSSNLKELSRLKTPNEVLAITYSAITEFEKEDFYCHDKAHHIGHFLFDYFDGDIIKALSNPNHLCGNALIHGIVEPYLPHQMHSNNIDRDDLDFTSPCESLGSQDNSYVGIQCVHGMGHGLAEVYYYDVIEAVLRCDEFQSSLEQEMCSDGIFMQNAVIQHKTKMGNFDDNDIFYPCNTVVERYQKKCFIFQGSYILSSNNYFPMKAIEECNKLFSESLTENCIMGVINHMVVINFDEVKKTAELCQKINFRYQDRCIKHAVSNVTLYVNPELGDDFCNNFSDEQKYTCINFWKHVKSQHYNS